MGVLLCIAGITLIFQAYTNCQPYKELRRLRAHVIELRGRLANEYKKPSVFAVNKGRQRVKK